MNAFATDGVRFPIRVLSDEELQHAQREYARIATCYEEPLKRFDRAHLYFRWAYDLARHPRVVDEVASIIGDDVIVWGTLVLSKPPHDPSFVAWHQDGAYAGFLGDAPSVSAWIALSDSTTESGCMRVVAGSHTQKLAHAQTHKPLNMLNQGHEIAAEVAEEDAVDVQLKAGEMSIHHIDIIHGSNANRAAWTRTGFIVRYTTPAMLRSATPVIIARGRDADHLDVHRAAPPADFAESIAAWRAR
jgi:ectoine hydroxylase-related dioxygenase (phytanoyl-CoA dioxygenase family)